MAYFFISRTLQAYYDLEKLTGRDTLSMLKTFLSILSWLLYKNASDSSWSLTLADLFFNYYAFYEEQLI